MNRRQALTFIVIIASPIGMAGCPGDTSTGPHRVRGRVIGAVKQLCIVEQTTRHPIPVSSDGTYEAGFDENPEKTRVEVDGEEGALSYSTVLSAAPVDSAGTMLIPPLGVWQSHLAYRREGPQLEFAWDKFDLVPLPHLRYSVRFTYDALSAPGTNEAAVSDAVLVTKDLFAKQTLAELGELMPSRDPAKKRMLVRVRAYDPEDANGPLWEGPALQWEVPPDLPVQAGPAPMPAPTPNP